MLFFCLPIAFESAAPDMLKTRRLGGAAIIGSHDDSVSAVFQLCHIFQSLPAPIWQQQFGFLTGIFWSKMYISVIWKVLQQQILWPASGVHITLLSLRVLVKLSSGFLTS